MFNNPELDFFIGEEA
jgi:actin-related protein 3